MRSLKDEQYRSPDPPTLSQAEIDENPHGIYRRLRPITPVIRREGGSYIAIRGRDDQQLATDPRIRKSETEVLRALVHSGFQLRPIRIVGLLSSFCVRNV
jgi:hypothetical protein